MKMAVKYFRKYKVTEIHTKCNHDLIACTLPTETLPTETVININ